MSLFNQLPGFVRCAPGLEQHIWRRLPAILQWGTALPVSAIVLNHVLAPSILPDGSYDAELLLRDYMLAGVVLLNWTLTMTTTLACFIVRVMKGPAYVADAYPLPVPAGDF